MAQAEVSGSLYFCCYPVFLSLVNQCKNGLHSVKRFTVLLKRCCELYEQLQSETARLSALEKSKQEKGKADLMVDYAQTVETVTALVVQEAQNKLTFANKVNDKVIKPLQEFHTLAELQLKALVYDEQKCSQTYASTRTLVERHRGDCMKHWVALSHLLNEKLHIQSLANKSGETKIKSGPNYTQLTQALKKEDKLKENCQKTFAKFEQMMEQGLQSQLTSSKSEMQRILTELEGIERKRLTELDKSFRAFAQLQREFLGSCDQLVLQLQSRAEKLSPQKELEKFVKQLLDENQKEKEKDKDKEKSSAGAVTPVAASGSTAAVSLGPSAYVLDLRTEYALPCFSDDISSGYWLTAMRDYKQKMAKDTAEGKAPEEYKGPSDKRGSGVAQALSSMAGDMDGKGLTALQQLKRKSGQALDPLREEPVQEHLTVTSSALRPRGASKARKLKEGKDTESGRELEGLGWLHLREEMPSAGATAWHRRYLRLNEQKNAIQFFLRPPTLFGMDGDEKPLGLIPLPGALYRRCGFKDYARAFCFGLCPKSPVQHFAAFKVTAGAATSPRGEHVGVLSALNVASGQFIILAADSERQQEDWLRLFCCLVQRSDERVRPSPFPWSSIGGSVIPWDLLSSVDRAYWPVLQGIMCDPVTLAARLSDALPSSAYDKLSKALVHACELGGTTIPLFRTLITREVENTASEGTLFRVDSLVTKMWVIFAGFESSSYLSLMVRDTLRSKGLRENSFEVNPRKLSASELERLKKFKESGGQIGKITSSDTPTNVGVIQHKNTFDDGEQPQTRAAAAQLMAQEQGPTSLMAAVARATTKPTLSALVSSMAATSPTAAASSATVTASALAVPAAVVRRSPSPSPPDTPGSRTLDVPPPSTDDRGRTDTEITAAGDPDEAKLSLIMEDGDSPLLRKSRPHANTQIDHREERFRRGSDSSSKLISAGAGKGQNEKKAVSTAHTLPPSMGASVAAALREEERKEKAAALARSPSPSEKSPDSASAAGVKGPARRAPPPPIKLDRQASGGAGRVGDKAKDKSGPPSPPASPRPEDEGEEKATELELEQVTINGRTLENAINQLLDSLVNSITYAPMRLRIILFHLQQLVCKRFPNSKHNAIGGFLFLRLICPFLLNADTQPKDAIEQRRARRNVLLMTKVLQNLSNGLKFGSKERYMVPLNACLEKNLPRVTRFFDQFVSPPGTVYSNVVEDSPAAIVERVEKTTEHLAYLLGMLTTVASHGVLSGSAASKASAAHAVASVEKKAALFS